MKKIIFLISCVLVVILIYVIKSDDKVIYFEISDNSIVGLKSVKYLSNKKLLEDHIYYKNTNNYRLIDVYNDITNNKKITFNNEDYTINNLFIKSRYIILNIGHNDLMYMDKSTLEPLDYIDLFISDYEDILKSIRSISKENIIVIFDYDLEEKYNDYLYNKMKLISNRYGTNMVYKSELLNLIKDFTKNKKWDTMNSREVTNYKKSIPFYQKS